MTPVRGDYEKHARTREGNARDNRPHGLPLEGRELCGDQPNPGKRNQQESNFGDGDARVVAEREHEDNDNDRLRF